MIKENPLPMLVRWSYEGRQRKHLVKAWFAFLKKATPKRGYVLQVDSFQASASDAKLEVRKPTSVQFHPLRPRRPTPRLHDRAALR